MILFLTFVFLAMICNPQSAFTYGRQALQIWYKNIVPALLPYLLVSKVLLMMGMAEKITILNKILLKPLLKIRNQGAAAVSMGLFGGFPVGAVLTSNLYSEKKISQKEAAFLLSFCNVLSPGYFFGVCLPLMGVTSALPYGVIFFGTPLLYGIVLRRTLYRDLKSEERTENGQNMSFLCALQESAVSSVNSILNIGAYMVFFQILQIVPEFLRLDKVCILAPLLEISSGLPGIAGNSTYIFFAASFGGICCAFQISEYLKICQVKLHTYLFHKLALAVLTTGLFLIFQAIN